MTVENFVKTFKGRRVSLKTINGEWTGIVAGAGTHPIAGFGVVCISEKNSKGQLMGALHGAGLCSPTTCPACEAGIGDGVFYWVAHDHKLLRVEPLPHSERKEVKYPHRCPMGHAALVLFNSIECSEGGCKWTT